MLTHGATRFRLSEADNAQRRRSRFVLVFLLVLHSLFCQTPAIACPSCKEHLAANGLDTGYAVSILIMILVPITIVATWTVLILRLRSFPQPESGGEVDAV